MATEAPQTADVGVSHIAQKLTAPKKGGLNALKKANLKFSIDASEPAADEIFDIAAFEKYLHDRFKIAGKTGVLGDLVLISRDGSTINVTSTVHFSKRYLKYLTKKFLKRVLLRDYIRVIARGKNNYYLKYFNFADDAADEDAADE